MVEIRRTSNGRRKQQIADRFADQVARKEALRLKGLRIRTRLSGSVWGCLGLSDGQWLSPR